MTSFRQLRQQRHGAWRRQAHNDLALAQLAKDKGFLAQSCYYASQAAANGLNGALLELGVEPPHTHVLNDLVQRLGDNGLNIEQLSTALKGAQSDGDPVALPPGRNATIRPI